MFRNLLIVFGPILGVLVLLTGLLIGGEADGEFGDRPSATITISTDGADDDETLEAQAEEVAEQMAEHIEQTAEQHAALVEINAGHMERIAEQVAREVESEIRGAGDDLRQAKADLRRAEADLREQKDELRDQQGELRRAKQELKRADDELRNAGDELRVAVQTDVEAEEKDNGITVQTDEGSYNFNFRQSTELGRKLRPGRRHRYRGQLPKCRSRL